MPTPVSPREMHTWIAESLGQQPDIGLRKAIVNMVLEAPNPFDPTARRKPKAGFLLGTILLAVSVGCFCYFNLLR
jgi:hypothetical protein